MSRLTDLIAHAKAKDPQLGADLDREFKVLSTRLPFGLNFERHSPEVVELPQRPVRKGDKVRVLPGRGSTKKGDQTLWQVKAIRKVADVRIADLELLGAGHTEPQSVSLGDLVVVAEFRDTIYPGLISTGKVQRGGNKPFHTVINGENYHVLKTLTYTHRGKVDAIYIDPPYNTGAKDWKYNNDYVEGDDLYRHSKWLAMLERRLLVAKHLLNPRESVLIATIDEKEYLRLGLLLEQLFPEATIQMVTSVIAPQGQQRPGQFSRIEEYLFVVLMGDCKVLHWNDQMIETSTTSNKKEKQGPSWDSLIRRGTSAKRADRPGMFYPIYVKDGEFSSVGEPLALADLRQDTKHPKDAVAVWPVRTDGSEGRWQVGPERLRDLFESGHAKVGRARGRVTPAIMYLKSGEIGRLERGDDDGENIISARSVWNRPSHNAGAYGSTLLRSILPERTFPFPKSLYAVEDALRFFIREKKEAVVLDFFSGSGTTAHAVMRLNRQDNGNRQCISVTNNEVAASEQKTLREQGLRPGDSDWEKWGICDYITKPRVEAAINGKTPDGELIKGDYRFTDEFPMAEGFEENAEFFTLTYETPVSVNHNLAFARIAPLLWMRAGSRGQSIDKLPIEGWAVVDAYGLLVDVDATTPFTKAVSKAKGLRVAYIVTDDDRRFQAIARRLPNEVEPVRLYESYLTNFSFANGE